LSSTGAVICASDCGDASGGGVTNEVEACGRLGEVIGSVSFDAGRKGTCGFTTFFIEALINCVAGLTIEALTVGVSKDVDFASTEGFVMDWLGFDRAEVDPVKIDPPNIERIRALATSLGDASLVFAAKAASSEFGVSETGADSGEPNSTLIRPANSGVLLCVLSAVVRDCAGTGVESAARIPI
jgi:hypothetical protein